MKSFKQFISEAREAKAFLAGDLPITKRKKKKVGQKVVSKKKSNDIANAFTINALNVQSHLHPEVTDPRQLGDNTFKFIIQTNSYLSTSPAEQSIKISNC